MGKHIVYIDGKEGTTGLQIYDRLAARGDIELLLIDDEKRKDTDERKKLINAADVVFLCLPDAAAKEAAQLCENTRTRIIDASTAHRTDESWTYGFPELSKEQRKAIEVSKRVANPGCHASGFISSVYPLVKTGIVPKDYPLTCCSLTGYSGGGKKMIAEYEAADRDERLSSDRIYGLDLKHKHLPEMVKVCGLERAPVFLPIVGDYYKGMATTIMLRNDMLSGKPPSEDIWEKLEDYYRDEHFVSVAPFGGDEKVIFASTNAGSNRLRLIVNGNGEQTVVTALLDNLGKGASGAAVQNMNIMLGLDEKTGLE